MTTHHSLIRYRLPTTGELVLLLQITPSKTDFERLLVVSPELADVLLPGAAPLKEPSLTPFPVTDALLHDLVTSSRAEGTDQFAAAASTTESCSAATPRKTSARNGTCPAGWRCPARPSPASSTASWPEATAWTS